MTKLTTLYIKGTRQIYQALCGSRATTDFSYDIQIALERPMYMDPGDAMTAIMNGGRIPKMVVPVEDLENMIQDMVVPVEDLEDLEDLEDMIQNMGFRSNSYGEDLAEQLCEQVTKKIREAYGDVEFGVSATIWPTMDNDREFTCSLVSNPQNNRLLLATIKPELLLEEKVELPAVVEYEPEPFALI